MPASSIRVLTIEDNLEEAELTRLMLMRSNDPVYQVHHADRLRAATARLREGLRPDVILLDLELPDCRGLDGFQVLNRQVPEIPVVMLTNRADDEIAAAAVRLGAQDYLFKREIDLSLLTRSIRYACERQKAERALRESEERYAIAVAGANDGIWDWRVDQQKVFFSPRWCALIGIHHAHIGDDIGAWLRRVHPEDLESLQAKIRGNLIQTNTHFEHEHRVRRADGRYIWVLARGIAIRGPDGRCIRMAGSMTDITDRKRTEAQLIHDALHDGLTGLPNRSLFQDRLAQAVRRYQRDSGLAFAVLYFDLDRFKYVNDSLGHSAGDELLVAVSEILGHCLRPGDSLARLGGDEFAILLGDLAHLSDAHQVADRIHELLSKSFRIQGHDIYTSASIGIAVSSPGYNNAEEILRDADLAMYRAKRIEGPQTAVFDDDMHSSVVAQLSLETDLRRAFQKGEFHVQYQPIVSVRTGRVNAFEALIRWDHPVRGLLCPDDFIQKAEETGMIVPLDWWTLEQACHQTAEWQRLFPLDPPLGINVNVSGKMLRDGDAAERIVQLLRECRLSPNSLRLELTERTFMDHHASAINTLDALREVGVQLYIDDFGTGYSSLSYLLQFSYDTLKIDKSFIQHLNGDGNGNPIVTTLVSLGRTLNMNVVAEGVETPEQLQLLRHLKCPEAQGFWFSRPVSTADALLYLREPRGVH